MITSKVFLRGEVLFLIYSSLLALTGKLKPLHLVIATTSPTEYGAGSGKFSELEPLQVRQQQHKIAATKIPKSTTFAFETGSSSLISTTRHAETTMKAPKQVQLPPQVKFEQEIHLPLNFWNNSFSESKDTLELNYTTQINPITLKEQRIILANLSRATKDYGCYILTCAAQYPVKWVTNIPIESQSLSSMANETCRFGDKWIYSMRQNDRGRGKLYHPLEPKLSHEDKYTHNIDEADLTRTYQIRLAFKIQKEKSGRIKCQSMANQNIFTDYYVYTQAGRQLVNYDGRDYKSVLEAFWEIPSVVKAALFKPDKSLQDNINYFFENKLYLKPEFSILNDSFMIIPCPSNYPETSLPPILVQKKSIGNSWIHSHDSECIVLFDYIYEPSIGFIFNDFNFVHMYFRSNCSITPFRLEKIEFSCYERSGAVVDINVHVTGNSHERPEFTQAFLDMLPSDAEKGVDYNYLLQNGDEIKHHHFHILPCNFPAECEIRRSSLDRYQLNNLKKYDSNRHAYATGNSTDKHLVSGLIRSFKYNKMLPSYLFFFTSLDFKTGSPRRYLLSENIRNKDVISIKRISRGPMHPLMIFSTEHIFRCTISNFVLMNDVTIHPRNLNTAFLISDNESGKTDTYPKAGNMLIKPLEWTNQSVPVTTDGGCHSWNDVTHLGERNADHGTTFIEFMLNLTIYESEIVCTAPWQNSTELITETFDVRKPNISYNGLRTIYYNKSKPIPDIVCSASGAPDLSFSWNMPFSDQVFRFHEIKSEIGESTLKLFPQADDSYQWNVIEGEYVCTVINSYGKDSTYVLLFLTENEVTGTSYRKGYKNLNEARVHVLTIILIAMLIIIFMVHFWVRIFRWRRIMQIEARTIKPRNLTEKEIHDFLYGKSQQNGSNFNLTSKNEAVIYSSCNRYIDVSHLPLDVQFIIPEAELAIDKTALLGEGNFGIVYRGRIKENIVAVKSVKSSKVDASCVKAFLEEIKIMAYIAQDNAAEGQQGKKHIINFIGVVVERLRKCVVYAVVELSPIGNLHAYLQTIREEGIPSFQSLLVNDTFVNPKTANLRTVVETTQHTSGVVTRLTTIDLITWCTQISAGMDYLASKRVIHGDLATRNALVFPHNVVKITDFGLSKKLYAYSKYVRTKDKKIELPWAWMALECLQHNTFSTESDVWSFGVVIWEIFSMGQFPYPGYYFSNYFVSALSNEMRMEKPTYASSVIYNQMLNCWKSAAEKRPSFGELLTFFKNTHQDLITTVRQDETNTGINSINAQNQNISLYIRNDYVCSSTA